MTRETFPTGQNIALCEKLMWYALYIKKLFPSSKFAASISNSEKLMMLLLRFTCCCRASEVLFVFGMYHIEYVVKLFWFVSTGLLPTAALQ